jgi:F-type H+-transporting ATPase subunit delta
MSQSEARQPSFDSDRQRLGGVYAKGLMGAAEKHQVVDRVLEQFDSLIDDALDKLPKFEQLLSSPRVSVESKLAVLDRTFADRMSPTFLNFLKVVAQHHRLDCLREMRSAFRSLYNEAHGRVAVEVRTADSVDRQLLEQITVELTAKLKREVDVSSTVQPDLLGGMVVRVGDTLFDGSLKNRLDALRADTRDRTTELVRDSLQRFIGSE